MTLLTKEVEVTLVSANIDYYENLGYPIYKRKLDQGRLQVPKGTKLLVKVEHLRNGSANQVDWQCDNPDCGEIFSCIWQVYINKIKYEEKDFCQKCLSTINNNTTKKIQKTKLVNNNFYILCIKYNRQDLLDRWDYIKNILKPNEIYSTQNIDIYFLCPEGIHDSQIKNIRNITSHKKGIENKHVYCSECYFDQYSLIKHYPNIHFIWSDNNKKSPNFYLFNEMKEVYWKCENEIHEDYERSLYESHQANFHCPECVNIRKESFLQEHVRKYLEIIKIHNGWILNHEENTNLTCKNKNSKYILPYDNELISDFFGLIIETHGGQHYEINGFHKMAARRNGTTPEEEFEYTQWKDEYKKQFALNNGYYYLAIPYWEDDKDETYKISIDNMLSYIYEQTNKEIN